MKRQSVLVLVMLVLSAAEISFSDIYNFHSDFIIDSYPTSAVNSGYRNIIFPLFDTSSGTLESVFIDVFGTSSWYCDHHAGVLPLNSEGVTVLIMSTYGPIYELDFSHELIREPLYLSGNGFFLSGTNTFSSTTEFSDTLIIDAFIERIDSSGWVQDNESARLYGVMGAFGASNNDMEINVSLDITYNYDPSFPSNPIYIQLPPGPEIIPAPPAVILGNLGLTFSGWLLRKRRML